MAYVIKAPEQHDFEKAGVKGCIFPTKNLTDATEFVLITTDAGHETTIIEHKCDFVYYILQGRGTFTINHKEETCKAGDLVVVPAGSSFTYQGNLKMLLVTTPPFTPDQEEIVS